MVVYKCADKDLRSRGFQYVVGQEYEHKGNISVCSSGFHACENPLDCLNYYNVAESRFLAVEQAGETKTKGDKTVSQRIKITAEIGLSGFVRAAVEYMWEKCTKGNDASKLAASGLYSQLAASGRYSKLAASGLCSKLTASGDDSIVMAAHNMSRVKVDGARSWMVLTEWGESADGDDYIKKVWAVKPGHKIKGRIIRTGCWYWFEGGDLREKDDGNAGGAS